MAKGSGSGKSSASSGTRKKHAKKALAGTAPGQPEELIPKEKKPKKKERGQKKKEPRVKAYIPPVKPAPVQPDPLETTGLVHILPAELLIVLRSFNKKAQVTKIRALEELQTAWVEKCRKEGEDGTLVHVLVEMLPVWLHHVSALFVHHSRRVRLLTASIHASLLQIHTVHEQILFFLRETVSTSQIESILGTWCMATHDVDRSVATMVQKSWNNAILADGAADQTDRLVLDKRFRTPLIAFTQRTILDPNGVYTYLNPAPPVSAPPPPKRGARKEDVEQGSRSKAEELEENEHDRAARLRVGAFGAIRRILETIQKEPSDDLIDFFKNAALWSSLHHAEHCPFIELESFGFGQPNVRKAGWTLIQTLLQNWKGHLEPLLRILSSGILRSAWVEADTTVHAVMWQPLLTFLKEFPGSWEVERIQEYNKNGGGEDSDSEESDPEEEKPSIAYQEFLRFLELGCSGSPLQGYPTVVIIISTIPSSVLASSGPMPPLANMFASFWKVLDGRALSSLQRSATSAAFLSALFECILFLVKRVRGHTQSRAILFGSEVSSDAVQETQQFVNEQVIKVWEELANKRLRVEQRAAARLMAQTLLSLHEIDEALFVSSWNAVSGKIKAAAESHPALVSAFLKIFQDRFKHVTVLREATAVLMADVLSSAVEGCEVSLRLQTGQAEQTLAVDGVELLVNMLDHFREGLFDEPHFSQRMDTVVVQHVFKLLGISPSLLLAYLCHREQESQCLRVWQALLSDISRHPDVAETSIKPLLDAVEREFLPTYLKPSTGEVDVLVQHLLFEVLSGDPTHSIFVRQVLLSPDYFLSEKGYTTLLESIISAYILQVDLALSDTEASLAAFEPPLELITALSLHPPRNIPRQNFDNLMPHIFIFAHLLPSCYDSEDHSIFGRAGDLWNQWLKDVDHTRKAIVLVEIKARLKSLLCDTQVRPLPQDILHAISQAPKDFGFNLSLDIFPTPTELDDMLHNLSPDPIHPSLAAVDNLIPPPSTFHEGTAATQLYDTHGFSSYARIVSALLQALVEDRKTAKQNVWALRHFHALEIYALDFQRVPSAQSPTFRDAALSSELFTIISKVEQVTTYVLTSSADEGWRTTALNAAIGNKTENLGILSTFLVNVIDASRMLDSTRDSRILRNILQHIFHDVEKDEADLWMLFARKIENKAPQTSMAIVSSITEFAPEPPRLDRYRNELAAGFLGVNPQKANTDGLLLLRKLAACAPNPDSDVVFLPQPRAVNIMKACQQWIASDEDIDEEVESQMTLIFFYLAPILQDIPGAHWDLIFDILENNLENSSMTDDDTLGALVRSLKLISLIQDLATTNKSLRTDWEERKMPIMTLVRDLATVSLDTIKTSSPVSTCRGLVLSIIQHLPESLIDQETLPNMSHLISDSSTEVQKVAYLFLQSAAKKRTEYFVIEAGVDTESIVKPQLPPQILDIIQRDVGFEQPELDETNVFGYLLGWMLLFDLFLDASLKVRSSYIEQLRNLDVIASHFIPTLLRLLRLDQGPLKAFKLDIWAVNEFHIEYYEAGSNLGLPLLVAHLYYRALLTVPSLIHTWILDCKDRQLSSSVTNYTSQYFSPVIIQTELAHVKSPESTALLVDENLTIKVANAVNEVVASYLVDEHQLEIKLKIPSDWPLHKIEIKDLKRVGVDENRWRAWILAVQQIIWSHNGRIVDGLGLFKKNVTLHFEGQVECAICYSIISVMDGTLPRKPCKTCKNRFHAGCLYKWFNSSHSSSCPLCRSDIF
ncbi:hypothetical protein BDZ94DRAFT_1068633 [Collybia nuda]|uniref:E3 ubiquitin-protein ligase listerin n=1 Tax=Collybia nuda TaxID=64659 RepID=A0A9P5Y088_9AGAR|nr:hypothetical protein BDZ94DRAFT_1068633 [Collybia nuda]